MLKIENYLKKLTQAHLGIREIWRLSHSSRGPTQTRPDWALLVFADKNTFDGLRRDVRFQRADVELLVVRENDEYCEPWGDHPERGYLSDWEWERVSDREARYQGTVWVNDEKLFRTTIELCKATRLWPADK